VDLTLERASAAIAARELGAVELVESLLARIEATEPAVHAWASVDADGALAAARRLDAEPTPRGPLHGIPIGLKDVIDTGGWPTEAGSRALAGRVPDADAEVVARLRAAGAIVLGKTVTHELAYGQNEPPTRSPWDPGRYPGGSSAGSGVALAVGGALGALGTDTGGSIRNPSALNALTGLKPTQGLVSTRGVIPCSHSLDVVGPMARTAAGVSLLLAGMADVPAAQPPRRVGVDRGMWERSGVAPCVADAAESALADLDAEIVECSLESAERALAVGLVIFACEGAAYHRERFARYEPGTRIMVELGALISGADYVAALRAREVIRRDVRATFEALRLDAFAGPTLPAPAWPLTALRTDFTRSGSQPGDLSGALRLLSWANVCGLPALSVPCGSSPEGLPLGLHLVGRPFTDAGLLQLTERFQQVTTWHELRPTGHTPIAPRA
jgi:Asp-tRNA(Asn)/Glu-tRNA(Gln) amidotransferase A subunit family amidase